jgi:hypothetical protein
LLPRLDGEYAEARRLMFETAAEARGGGGIPFTAVCQRARAFYEGRWETAIADLTAVRRDLGYR